MTITATSYHTLPDMEMTCKYSKVDFVEDGPDGTARFDTMVYQPNLDTKPMLEPTSGTEDSTDSRIHDEERSHCGDAAGRKQVTADQGFDAKRRRGSYDVEESMDAGAGNLRCGWYGWKPECLQRFNSAPWLLVVMCIVVLFQGMVASGFIGSSATSIERRFQLSSQDYGILVSVYEITNIVFILFVTFIGGRGHKPRWVAVGCVLVGLGSLLFALPHFTTDAYADFHDGDGDAGICEKLDDDDDSMDAMEGRSCQQGNSESGLSKYIYVFAAAQVLLAMGSLPVYTLGVAVLDESVSAQQSGFYMGILYALSTVGPALGYVIAGVCLAIFTDLQLPDGVDLTEEDPGWVGAWWIGFVLVGACMLIFAIPLGAFPRELPGTAKIRAERECQAHANAGSEITARPSFGSRPSDLPVAIKYLSINPTFMCTTFAGCSDMLLITAFGIFLPKFIENQFSTTATVATAILGVCVVPGGAGGAFFGGWLARKLQLRVPGLLKFCIITTIATTLTLPCLFVRCPQTALAGILTSYEAVPTGNVQLFKPNLTHECNVGCGCSTEQYNPVCLPGLGLEYFSPCHAGCTDDFENGTYINCLCAQHATGNSTGTVVSGKCGTDCITLPIFVCLLVFLLAFLFMSMVPALNVTLRSVPESQRSMALGLQSFIGRCLGSIPGPIFFGIIIDSTCLQWQETCDGYGSCWLYDNESLAWRLVVLACSLKVVSGCMYITAWFSYRPAESPIKTGYIDMTTKAVDC